MVYEVMLAAARDTDLAADLRPLLAQSRTAVAGAIRRWHPTAADPDVLAETLLAVLDGLALHLLAEPELDVARHVDVLMELLGPETAPREETL